MNRLERAARRNPGLYAFGTAPLRRLTAEEEAVAPFEDRLRSVWSYLVLRARRFVATLSGRERAHLDAEDLVDEIVCALLRKDGKWDPKRGRYVTFAEAVIRNVIVTERERARVVRAPANARARLERYKELDAAGKLKEGPRRTMEAIARALGEMEAIRHAAAPASPEPDEATPDRELIEALKGLGPTYALVLAGEFGLFDATPRTPAELARVLPGGRDPRQVRELQIEARDALRDRIERIRRENP